MEQRVPVTLLTGFLGSGKTTILNAWLGDPDLHDAAVIVNEFGEIGIDHELIAASNDNTIELSTGCLCCSVQGDLVETLRDLAERRSSGAVRRFDRVLIETTGLADPVPVIQALIAMPVARAYRLSRVVTVVDAVQGLGTLDRHPEAVRQAAVADVLVLSKTDLGNPDATLEARLRDLNPTAPQYRSRPAETPPASLLRGIDVYDPAVRPDQVQAWLAAEAGHHHQHRPNAHDADPHPDPHDENRHDAAVASFTLVFDAPLHWEHVATWLDALVRAHGEDLLRVKGILDIAGRARPIVVQTVQRLFHPPAELPGWGAGRRQSRIVFITRNLGRDYVAEVLATIQTRRPAA